MKLLFTFLCACICISAQAQYLTGLATKWSDSFSEWTIFTDDESVEGDLEMKWKMQNDVSEWQYRIGEEIGRIKLKWRDNPNEWEIRGNNQIITARTLWNNQFREWRIKGNGTQFTLRCKYGNTTDEWELRNSSNGIFEIYTNWEGDPREWNIVDELDESIGLPMKMAIVFIATFHSIPR